mgnify:CR=1 FL=1
MKKNTSSKKPDAATVSAAFRAVENDVKVIHAHKAVATFYVKGDETAVLLLETVEQVARRAYETLHACELTREQRLTLGRALVVLEVAAL